MEKIEFAKPYFGQSEYNSVLASLQRPDLTNSRDVATFESLFESFVGGGKAVAVSNCAAALWISMMDMKPGDEVICPALTHVSTVHAIELHGATPVFVDSDRSGNIDMDKVMAVVTPRTKALAVVHFLGVPVEFGTRLETLKNKGIRIVEDCALALGAFWRGKHVGLSGDVGCFSFYPCKHITTGEGGMLLTTSLPEAERAKKARHFGQNLATRDVKMLGLNLRMTEMQGALGCSQIHRIRKILDIRERNYNILRDRLKDKVEIVDHSNGSYYAFCFFCPIGMSRNTLRRELVARGIGTSVYYEIPVPKLKYYRKKYKTGEFLIAEEFSEHSVCLPVGPHISQEDAHRIADTVLGITG